MSTDINGAWPLTRVEELVRLWRDGWTAGQLAKHFALTRNQVIGKLNRLGLKRSAPSAPTQETWTPPRVEKLVALYGTMSDAEVADRIGPPVTRHGVTAKAAKLGLAPPESAPPRPKPKPRPAAKAALAPIIFGKPVSAVPVEPTPVVNGVPVNAIPWSDRQPNTCARPYGDPRVGLKSCPRRALPGESYCLQCASTPGLYAYRPRVLAAYRCEAA